MCDGIPQNLPNFGKFAVFGPTGQTERCKNCGEHTSRLSNQSVDAGEVKGGVVHLLQQIFHNLGFNGNIGSLIAQSSRVPTLGGISGQSWGT